MEINARGCTVIDDQQIVQSHFIQLLAGRAGLIILDALSFPWELLGNALEELPFYVLLPSAMDLETVRTVFGDVLSKVTFCDRVVVPYERIGTELAKKYHWARCQWSVCTGAPSVIAEALLVDFVDRESLTPKNGSSMEGDEIFYWRTRGATLAKRAPERAVCSVRHSLRENKHMHIRQSAALNGALKAVWRRRSSSKTLEIGCGVGRWVSTFERLGMEYIGIDGSFDAIRACRENHPDASFVVAEARGPLPIPDSSVELVAFVTVFHHLDYQGKRSAIKNAWRTLRPGGVALFLESFVGAGSRGATTFPISWPDMQEMIVRETLNTATLEHFETVSYRHLAGTKAALVVFSKLNNP
jgi:SAM-dependent methyltransferase